MITNNDYIKINKVNISTDDMFVLSRLYLPLMGYDSVTLYTFLNNYEDEISVRVVLDYFHFDTSGNLEFSLNKLEALGLVKRYKNNKTNEYLLEFVKPLSKNAFMKDSFLSNLLIKNIGEVEYNKLKETTKVLKGFTEETKSYDEVFKIKNKTIKITNVEVPNEIANNIKIKNDNFDYLVFKMNFDEEELSRAVLDDSEFERIILKISYQYSLSELEMKEIILQSMAKNNDLRYSDIERRASYVYQSKESNMSDFPEKTPEEYVLDLTSEENDILQFAIKLPINKALEFVSGGKGSVAEIRDFTNLVDIHHIPIEVVNVLIFHLYMTKATDIITYNYLEKVAVGWKKAGVKTAKDALIHIREKEKEIKEAKANKKSFAVREAEEPEWLKNKNEGKKDKDAIENAKPATGVDINQFFKKVTDKDDE